MKVNRLNATLFVALTFIVMIQPCLLRGQTSGLVLPQCPSGSTSERCSKQSSLAPNEPSAAQKFPFPEVDNRSAKDMRPVLTAPIAEKKGGDKSEEPASPFPYPGEASAPLADSDPAASSSSSSSSTNDPDMPSDLNDVGSEGTTRRRLPKVTKLQSDTERADEDLSVASFYRYKGDLNAAYLRLKDAVKVQPNSADAHLALAKLAEKMKKKEEASDEFKLYLRLDPGEQNNDVHRALAASK